MNMNDDFEKRLQRQPLRQIPAEWRAEILQAANSTAPSRHSTLDTRHTGWLSTLNSQLSTILWPHPKAWAGLAAVWIGIFALQFASRDTTQMVARNSVPPSPELIATLKSQEKLLAELLNDNSEVRIADRQKIFSPRPRSDAETHIRMA
jgi:hypothetical protein